MADLKQFIPIEIAAGGGKIIDLNNLKPSDINIEEIFKTLARKGRFNDNSDRKVSVAAHLLLVSDLVENDRHEMSKEMNLLLRVIGLLHDTSEAFIGDIVTGVKRSPYMKDVSILEDQILMTIFESQGFDFEECEFTELMSRIKKYDRQALSLEVPYAFDYVDPQWYSDGWINREYLPVNLRFLPQAYNNIMEWQQVELLKERLFYLKEDLNKVDSEHCCGLAALLDKRGEFPLPK